MAKSKRVSKAKNKIKKKLSPSKKKVLKKSAAKKSTAKKAVKSKKVSAIPKGYNSVTPYLIVNNGAKAIEFYKNALGAKLVFSMERHDGKIGHAELKIGDSKIMLGDECAEMGALSPAHFEGTGLSIHLYVKNVDAVIERAVAAGAQLTRPVANMFYGDRSGGLKDPFGHHWYVATHIEDLKPAQIKKRAAELFGKR
jgi:PhnB protein